VEELQRMQAEQPPVLIIVEDDELVRLTLADALADAGFEVLEAAEATSALALVCDRPDIAAMLTDINLPGGIDGFALARAARRIRPILPVVYASGRFAADEGGRAVEGAVFLAKPFPVALACRTLRDLLRARPPQARLQPADCNTPRAP